MPLSTLKTFLQHHLHSRIQRLVVAYSGGVDSHVLLHALVALKNIHHKPIVLVHVHHGISQFADDWTVQAQLTAEHYGITCIIKKVTVAKTASLESAAREARYQALQSVLTTGDVLLLAHHQNDQAETLLLRLIRGSGVRGLAAMQAVGIVPFQSLNIPCWRPLLTVKRQTIMHYAQQHGLQWIEDDSNTNTLFNRNYLRHQIIPLLQQRWPSVNQQLADTSQRMREADELLQELAAIDYQQAQLAVVDAELPPLKRGIEGDLQHNDTAKLCESPLAPLCQRGELPLYGQPLSKRQQTSSDNALNIQVLRKLTAARRNNLLRYWLQQQQLALPDYADLMRVWSEVCLAQPDAEPLLAWRGVEIRRYQQQLFAMTPLIAFNTSLEIPWVDKNQPLLLPSGESLSPTQAFTGINATMWQIGQVSIRYRQGGEKIQPIGRHHHHELKKLLQVQGVPTWQRQRIPLLYINQQLAAVLGYWIAKEFAA